MVEMAVDSVRVSMSNQQRVVILKDLHEERYLFIWISADVALAIAQELQGTVPQRPLTHDLLKAIITQMGGRVVSVTVTEIRQQVYHSQITIEVGGKRIEVDSRTSDAIALAVRAKCPIFAAESVLEEAGVIPEEMEPGRKDKRGKAATSSETPNLDAYRDFINSLDILDEFGKD